MSKILRVLTSRVGIIGSILLLQLLWILAIMFSVSRYHMYISAVFTVIGCCMVIYISNQWKDPAYKMVWYILIMGMPLVGCVLYLLFGRLQDVSIYMKRYRKIRDSLKHHVSQKPDVLEKIKSEDDSVYRQVHYLEKHCGYPVYEGVKAEYFPDGAEYFESLCSAIEDAKSFVFLEFFIICEGAMWDRLHKLLRAKARDGVEIRIFYDDLGSFRLPGHSVRELEADGIKCKRFNPLRPVLTAVMNNRDHRKIVVVDGKTAFTGGINLADEYIHEKIRFGFWKDCGVRIDGKAAESFTVMFLEMWNATEKSGSGDDERFFPDLGQPGPEVLESAGCVQPYADNPLDAEFIGGNVYLNMIHHAVHYIYFFTPYLILTEEILRALVLAAKNGVDVRIVTPHIPDKKLTFMVTRSYYPQLLAAGVKLYEFTPGFIHSKCCICDDKLAVVGSVNLDYRSFYLHFEDGMLLYRSPAIQTIKEDFEETFRQSVNVSEDFLGRLPWHHRIIASCLRLAAPML